MAEGLSYSMWKEFWSVENLFFKALGSYFYDFSVAVKDKHLVVGETVNKIMKVYGRLNVILFYFQSDTILRP